MIQVKVIVPADGNSLEIHVASLISDLWCDYCHFRQQAEATDPHVERLQHKRLVRAAIHSFFGYFEGVLNTWIPKIEAENSCNHMSFKQKMDFVQKLTPQVNARIGHRKGSRYSKYRCPRQVN